MPLEVHAAPADPDARARIVAALDQHARTAGHPFDIDEFLVEAHDGDAWLGGLTARITQGWAFIHLLAVAPDSRRQGVGSRLMLSAEQEARTRGLLGVWLDTYSFQAPGFYAKLGYDEVGRIPDCPPGHARIFLAKRFDGRPLRATAP